MAADQETAKVATAQIIKQVSRAPVACAGSAHNWRTQLAHAVGARSWLVLTMGCTQSLQGGTEQDGVAGLWRGLLAGLLLAPRPGLNFVVVGSCSRELQPLTSCCREL